LTGDAADVLLKDQTGKIIADGSNPAYSRFNDSVQRAAARDGNRIDWGGNWKSRKDWDHWELSRASKSPALTEGRSAFAGSTQSVARAFERKMKSASDKIAPDFAKDLQTATKGDTSGGAAQPAQQISQQSNDASGSLLNLGSSIANLATNSKNAPSAIMSVAQSIMQLISQLSSAGGGGGGIFGAIGGLLGGLFEEGGYSGSPVASATMPASFWAGAPHYAEGTPNTSGGMPAILHDNEAVVPLSRGRSIPVELSGAGGGGDSVVNNIVKMNLQAKDHDSFRRSKGQMAAEFHKMAARMHVRNN
jgi:hypothetical protein